MRRQHGQLLTRRARGFGLIDALVALAILSFGLVGLTRLQARSLSYGTEAQQRATASQLGSEILSTAMIDSTRPGCYTLPTPGTCTSTSARDWAAAFRTRVAAALPDGAVRVEHDATSGRMTVVITWTGKGSTGGLDRESRRLEASTHV